jgi:hypothetical protein
LPAALVAARLSGREEYKNPKSSLFTSCYNYEIGKEITIVRRKYIKVLFWKINPQNEEDIDQRKIYFYHLLVVAKKLSLIALPDLIKGDYSSFAKRFFVGRSRGRYRFSSKHDTTRIFL